jgi:hypothetical protein
MWNVKFALDATRLRSAECSERSRSDLGDRSLRCGASHALDHVPIRQQRVVVLERPLDEDVEHVHELACTAQFLSEPRGRAALPAAILRAFGDRREQIAARRIEARRNPDATPPR